MPLPVNLRPYRTALVIAGISLLNRYAVDTRAVLVSLLLFLMLMLCCRFVAVDILDTHVVMLLILLILTLPFFLPISSL